MTKNTEKALVIAQAKARRRLVELADKSKMEITRIASDFAAHGGLLSSKYLVAIGLVATSTAKELVGNLTTIYVETVGTDLPKDLAVAAITKTIDEFYSGFRSKQQSSFTGLAGHAAKILQKLDEQIAALKTDILEGLDIALFDARTRVGTINSPSTDKREAEKENGRRFPRYLFRKIGSHWDVSCADGQVFHMEDTLGAKYLNYLLHHPNEPISAYDLEIAIHPEKAEARPKDSIQNDLDAKAKREYSRELNELLSEREKAEENPDESKIARLDREIDYLKTALGKNGQAPDSGERARGNVSKAIAAVRRKLLKGSRAEKRFAGHIKQFVSVGYECIYIQSQGRIWQ